MRIPIGEFEKAVETSTVLAASVTVFKKPQSDWAPAQCQCQRQGLNVAAARRRL